jgi:hypothetical protein
MYNVKTIKNVVHYFLQYFANNIDCGNSAKMMELWKNENQCPKGIRLDYEMQMRSDNITKSVHKFQTLAL